MLILTINKNHLLNNLFIYLFIYLNVIKNYFKQNSNKFN